MLKQVDNDPAKGKLLEICNEKIRTTMIGALSAFEEQFKYELTNTDFSSAYQEFRKLVLDNGNLQMRNLEKEFSRFKIDWFSKITFKLG